MLSFSLSPILPTMLRAVVRMSFAALRGSVSAKVSMGGWFGAISTRRTENRQATSNAMQLYAGELRPWMVLWKRGLTFVLLAQLLETFRMVQLRLHFNGRGKGRSRTHIASTPRRKPGMKIYPFYYLHAEHQLTVRRLFVGWLRACALSVLLKTVAFAAS